MTVETIDAQELAELRQKARHLDRARAVFEAAYFNEGLDRVLNATRFHDLLCMEEGADKWREDAFLGEEIPD